MSMEKQEHSEITSMVENALAQLNDVIQYQEQQNQKASRISRYGLIAVILLSFSVVFLAWSLKQDMSRMSTYMEEMAVSVSGMSNGIAQMQTSISTMKGGIMKVASNTQSISNSIVQPDNSVAVLTHIADSVTLLQTDAHGFSKSIENINYNLSTINKHMRSLNRKLGALGQDANRMPIPGNMFPF